MSITQAETIEIPSHITDAEELRAWNLYKERKYLWRLPESLRFPSICEHAIFTCKDDSPPMRYIPDKCLTLDLCREAVTRHWNNLYDINQSAIQIRKHLPELYMIAFKQVCAKSKYDTKDAIMRAMDHLNKMDMKGKHVSWNDSIATRVFLKARK
jgi:hypothetical protein